MSDTVSDTDTGSAPLTSMHGEICFSLSQFPLPRVGIFSERRGCWAERRNWSNLACCYFTNRDDNTETRPPHSLPLPPALTEYTAPEGLVPRCPNSFFFFLILRLDPKPHKGQARALRLSDTPTVLFLLSFFKNFMPRGHGGDAHPYPQCSGDRGRQI